MQLLTKLKGFYPTSPAWRITLAIATVALLLSAIARLWSVFLFTLTYGFGFGSILWYHRHVIERKLRSCGFLCFLFIATGVSILEEVWCYLCGGTLARPVLWQDLLVISISWVPWFLTWRYYLSHRYRFTLDEAVLLSGLSGLLFEFVPKPQMLANIAGLLIMAPLIVIIYATTVIVPICATNLHWAEKRAGILAKAEAVILPYLAGTGTYILASVILGDVLPQGVFP